MRPAGSDDVSERKKNCEKAKSDVIEYCTGANSDCEKGRRMRLRLFHDRRASMDDRVDARAIESGDKLPAFAFIALHAVLEQDALSLLHIPEFVLHLKCIARGHWNVSAFDSRLAFCLRVTRFSLSMSRSRNSDNCSVACSRSP